MVYSITQILESVLGNSRKHNHGAAQIAFDCPECSEEKNMPQGDGKGNLEINYKKNVYRCWACSGYNNTRGNIFKLIKTYGSKKDLEDYRLLLPSLDFDTTYTQTKTVTEDLKRPEGYKRLSKCTSNDYLYDKVMYYLKKRGVTDELIKKYDIGYSSIGKYHDRIIIPSTDEVGGLNYFVTRAFDYKVKPKYLNPDVDKQTIIFNHGKINFDSTIYLVEGVFDHIVIPNSIPLLGKYVSDKLFLELQKAKGYIVILLDSDAVEDAINIYKKLNSGKFYGRIKMNVPPDGHDPSTIYQKLGSRGIKKLIEGSYIPSESRIY
jgi:hypothetical protein